MIRIRPYEATDEKAWVYTKALSYLFSPFFDDRETSKPPLDREVFEDRLALVAEVEGNLVGLLDIDIYNTEYSRSYRYAPADKVAYFTNLAFILTIRARASLSVCLRRLEKLCLPKMSRNWPFLPVLVRWSIISIKNGVVVWFVRIAWSLVVPRPKPCPILQWIWLPKGFV